MKSEYREIWSTPIGEYWLEDQKLHQMVVDMSVGTYDTSPDFDILKNNKNEFTEWVKSCCIDYVSKFYKQPFTVDFKRSWITTQNYGEPNEAHSHGATDVVGVYYIQSTEEHPDLVIYDPRAPHIFNEAKIIKNGNVICDCARSTVVKTLTGKLVFFPGYLLHGVDTNISRNPRLSLAMNIKLR